VGLFLEELAGRLGALYEREVAVARELVEVVGKV
jgi:hypothetical protein